MARVAATLRQWCRKCQRATPSTECDGCGALLPCTVDE